MQQVDVIFRSDMTVKLIDSMASDYAVVQAARVSTLGEDAVNQEAGDRDEGLIKYLMRDRHGSPFEHAVFKFYIEAPIFVWREFMRHRIASYNEESGRYKKLEPVFYVPDANRPLVQTGKPGAYVFEQGTIEQLRSVRAAQALVDGYAYGAYDKLLSEGIAREVARMTLPLNIYSSAFVTMNARALMNFLSLRTKSEYSTFPSFPQREIEMVAEQMESEFSKIMPITWAAFHYNGRVAP